MLVVSPSCPVGEALVRGEVLARAARGPMWSGGGGGGGFAQGLVGMDIGVWRDKILKGY